MARILDGLKVVDITNMVAGPVCTLMLADNGAEVIKIERPIIGDDIRDVAPKIAGTTTQVCWFLRGKKSVVVDMTSPEGLEIVKKIIADSDVFVENMRPGVLEKLGLSYDVVKKIKPNIVYCSISTFGQDGPYAKKPGYELIAQGISGLLDLNGFKGGPPVRTGYAVGDFLGGSNAYAAIMSALYYREKTGKGQYIDISLLEGLLMMNAANVAMCSVFPEVNPSRQGNYHRTNMPYGLFEGKGGQWAVICSPNQKLWGVLCNLMGKPEYITDERFSTLSARFTNCEQTANVISDWLKTFDEIQDAIDVMEANGIPCSKVKTTRETYTDPQVLARQAIIDLPVTPHIAKNTDVKTIKAVAPCWRFSETPSYMTPAPDLGQHNYEILTRYGLSVEEIDKLEAKWEENAKNKR